MAVVRPLLPPREIVVVAPTYREAEDYAEAKPLPWNGWRWGWSRHVMSSVRASTPVVFVNCTDFRDAKKSDLDEVFPWPE
jgi:hypothetical protein